MALATNSEAVRAGTCAWGRPIVKWLVEPLVAVDEKQRRRLRLLSSFMLLMAVNTFTGMLVLGKDEGAMWMILQVSAAGFALGYILSRTRYHGVATALAINLPTIAIIAILSFIPERAMVAQHFPWLALPLLICSLILSLRSTIIIASINVLVISTLSFALGIPVMMSGESLAYLVVIVFFVVALTAIRQQDQREIEHQLREREQAEEALKESEEKFSSAFKTSPVAIGIVSVATGNFIEANEGLSRFIGYPVEEIIGHNSIDLNLWVDENELNQMAADLQGTNRVIDREFKSRRKSGEVRQGIFSAEVININGKPCVILVITDITERKRAEQRHKDENRILTLLSQGTPLRDLLDAILLMGEQRDPSTKGSLMLVDPSRMMLVHAAGPSLAEDFRKLLAGGMPILEGAGSCGTAAYRKQRVIVPDISHSSLFQADIIQAMSRNNMFAGWSEPIISSSGELLGTICNFCTKPGPPDEQNIATLEWSARIAGIAIERKRAEDALRESEAKFSKAFHASPHSMVITTLKDGRFIEANDGHTVFSGHNREETIGRTAAELNSWARKEDRDRILKIIKAKGRVNNEEIQFRRKSGDIHVGLFSAEKINIGGEECLISVTTDITERKQAEEELKKAMSSLEKSAAQLRATNRELETFSYSVSHDLRSPLRSIDGFSQALLEDYQDKLDEQGRDYLNRLRLASQKMGELIDGLLKLSRLTRSEMHLETVDLGALAREIVMRLQEEQPERKVEFYAGDSLTANGDPYMLRALLENLIGNAWKFSSKNPQARIEFGKVGVNGKTEFFIRDNGIGFDMAYAGKLFGAFQRLHSSDDFPGTGIGLATVQRIVNRHGGTIRAEGEVGKGATFYFTLT